MDPYSVCLGLGVVQLAFTARFLARLRSGLRRPLPESCPRAVLLVPCAGAGPGLRENVLSVLEQDYPGRLEVLFVTPSEADPAYAAIRSALAAHPGGARARLLASGLRPERSSGKIADLLFALGHLPPEAELLLFADGDVRLPRQWARALAGGLGDPAAGAATAVMLYVPARLGLWSLLRLAWTAWGMPYLEWLGVPAGHSLALSRRDFERLGVAGLWSRSLMEDLSLGALLRRSGLRVRFCPRALPVSAEGCSAGELFAVFNRWVAMFRVYDKRVWVQGALVTAAKAAFLGWALAAPGRRWPLLALLFGMDAANLLVLLGGLSAALPGRLPRLYAPLAALAAPLLQAVFLVNFLASLGSRRFAWGPRVYRVRAPQDVEVVG